MSSLLALAFLLAPAAPWPAVPELAGEAIATALAVPGARAEVLDVQVTTGQGCPAERAETLRPVTGSGQIPLRFMGSGTGPGGRACEAFGWARVRVVRIGLVTSRPVATGEALDGAVQAAEVEVRTGRPPAVRELPAGARAGRALTAGAPLSAADVREGPLPGEAITVVFAGGGLELSREGRALPCKPGRACALLPGGRRVEGRPEGGRLVLEAP